MVLTLSIAADTLAFGGSEGFGWRQQIGLILAAAVLLMGALARSATLAVVGLVGCGLSFLADSLGFGSGEGFGNQQISGVLLGATLIVIGPVLSRRRAKEHSAPAI